MEEKNKTQKGLIQTQLITIIILSFIVISGLGVSIFLYTQGELPPFFKEPQSKLEQSSRPSEESVTPQKSDEETQKRITELEQKIEEIEKKQQISPEDQQKDLLKSPEQDLVSIINQWQPVIAYLECDFYYADIKVKYLTQSGSGLLAAYGYSDNPDVYIITNKHVVSDNYGYQPAICRIKLPEYKNIINTTFENIIISAKGYDWATISIENPDDYLQDLPRYKVCDFQLSVGEPIVILGYPAIGSKTDITATEGIISGYDGDYYITSAKIDLGNSGGAAIFLKANCYIGIPTFATVGVIESLARILKAQTVFSGLNQ